MSIYSPCCKYPVPFVQICTNAIKQKPRNLPSSTVFPRHVEWLEAGELPYTAEVFMQWLAISGLNHPVAPLKMIEMVESYWGAATRKWIAWLLHDDPKIMLKKWNSPNFNLLNPIIGVILMPMYGLFQHLHFLPTCAIIWPCLVNTQTIFVDRLCISFEVVPLRHHSSGKFDPTILPFGCLEVVSIHTREA